MITIAGNGVGDYDFKRINLDLNSFDKIVCDKNFKEDGEKIVKLGFKDAKEYLQEIGQDMNILYVVTGSPLFFSGGTLLARDLEKQNIPFKIIDNQSSKSYILSHFGISESECGVLSLHGRNRIDLENFLTKRWTLVLCDENSGEVLKEATKYLKNKDLKIYIGSRLGYEDEKIEEIDLSQDLKNLMPYVLLVRREYEQPFKISNDEDFEKERGMITKSYKRQLSLQFLDLEPNQILWDVGAGSGSVGIDGGKRYRVKTIFFEKNEKRCKDIKNNLSNHKVVDTKLFEGNAAENFEKAENPDRIFIGGGAEEVMRKLPYLFERLSDKGIILINLVTLQTLTTAIQTLKENDIQFAVQSLSLTDYKTDLLIGENSRELYFIKIVK